MRLACGAGVSTSGWWQGSALQWVLPSAAFVGTWPPTQPVAPPALVHLSVCFPKCFWQYSTCFLSAAHCRLKSLRSLRHSARACSMHTRSALQVDAPRSRASSVGPHVCECTGACQDTAHWSSRARRNRRDTAARRTVSSRTFYTSEGLRAQEVLTRWISASVYSCLSSARRPLPSACAEHLKRVRLEPVHVGEASSSQETRFLRDCLHFDAGRSQGSRVHLTSTESPHVAAEPATTRPGVASESQCCAYPYMHRQGLDRSTTRTAPRGLRC